MRWGIAGRPGRTARTLRPMVVGLEARLVLTTSTVTQFSDGTSTGTLRWAINQADQTPGQNTVVLRPGVYTLTQSGPEFDGGQTGALQVAGNVTIKSCALSDAAARIALSLMMPWVEGKAISFDLLEGLGRTIRDQVPRDQTY